MDIEIVSVEAEENAIAASINYELIEYLEANFKYVLGESSQISNLAQGLSGSGLRYCVYGGWVRDKVSEFQYQMGVAAPRDVDLVVHGMDLETLLTLMPVDTKPTIFGGIQSMVGPISFDIWPLHETFLIKHLGLTPTFENLLRVTDFTVNAGCFFPGQQGAEPEMLDGGMLKAIGARELAFNGKALPFPTMQCARLAAYATKLSLGLSPAVRAFMKSVFEDPARREAVLAGLFDTYPEKISIHARRLLEELTEGAP